MILISLSLNIVSPVHKNLTNQENVRVKIWDFNARKDSVGFRTVYTLVAPKSTFKNQNYLISRMSTAVY